MIRFEKDTLRGMTMYRKIEIGSFVYEFDRKEGTREISW